MAQLLKQHWLPRAKRLAIGMKDRVYHGNENRPNLVIGNEPDRWWAYCQRCGVGDIESKVHATLSYAPPVPKTLTVPTDRVRALAGTEASQILGPFLASKGVLYPVLPELWYSDVQKRMLLQDPAGKWHGRDITGHSSRKWLNYSDAKFSGAPGDLTVVTEDLFSMYKVRFALRKHLEVAVCCSLGAGIADAGALALSQCKHIVWFYDGDRAGYAGAAQASKRMRPFGAKQSSVFPPVGKDPKDLDSESIRVALKEFL